MRSDFTAKEREDLLWFSYAQRLDYSHGFERAVEILERRDPEFEADLAAWRKLGGRA